MTSLGLGFAIYYLPVDLKPWSVSELTEEFAPNQIPAASLSF